MTLLGEHLDLRGARRLWQRLDSLGMRAARRWLGRIVSGILDVALAASMAAAIGLGTAWYMIEFGPGVVEQYGPWRSWPDLGRPEADPYTRAQLARSGRLVLSSAQARYFTANTDSSGSRLFGDCEYEIAGIGPAGAWWSLSVYDQKGNLIPHPSRRYAVSSASALRAPNGRITIRLSAEARPGNWLPVGSDGAVLLLLRLYGPDVAADEVRRQLLAESLFEITRIACP
jgi:hypothetical protein